MGHASIKKGAPSVWVFGYGSLIYKADFPFLERRVASITGWERRFWQGSHDHRGTPHAPGRVVTLIASAGARCKGVAYRVEPPVFDHLDHREKNGYLRVETTLHFEGGESTPGESTPGESTPGESTPGESTPGESTPGIVYIADQDNHAYLGPAPVRQIAEHISVSRGPSGCNRDYLLQLASALRELGAEDAHVFELAALVSRDPSGH